jgi:hypothetical protein
LAQSVRRIDQIARLIVIYPGDFLSFDFIVRPRSWHWLVATAGLATERSGGPSVSGRGRSIHREQTHPNRPQARQERSAVE